MSRRVSVDDLIDARDVAEILGLAHRNTVSQYQSRYPDMPRPVVDLGRGRPMLWLRSEIHRQAAHAQGDDRDACGLHGVPDRTGRLPKRFHSGPSRPSASPP